MTPTRYAALVACAASNVRRLGDRSWSHSLHRHSGVDREARRAKHKPGAEYAPTAFHSQLEEGIAGRFYGLDAQSGRVRKQGPQLLAFSSEVRIERAINFALVQFVRVENQ
jgi:hypothetical protein